MSWVLSLLLTCSTYFYVAIQPRVRSFLTGGIWRTLGWSWPSPQPCTKQMLRDAMRSQAFLLNFFSNIKYSHYGSLYILMTYDLWPSFHYSWFMWLFGFHTFVGQNLQPPIRINYASFRTFIVWASAMQRPQGGGGLFSIPSKEMFHQPRFGRFQLHNRRG